MTVSEKPISFSPGFNRVISGQFDAETVSTVYAFLDFFALAPFENR
jgi:hypothetical protein